MRAAACSSPSLFSTSRRETAVLRACWRACSDKRICSRASASFPPCATANIRFTASQLCAPPAQHEHDANQDNRGCQGHEQSYAQASGVFGDGADQARACRSSERSERKEDASNFFRGWPIPSREPSNENGIDARASQACQKNCYGSNRERSGCDQQCRSCCGQTQSAQHYFFFV